MAESKADFEEMAAAEHLRRWWATYNASLTGLIANSDPGNTRLPLEDKRDFNHRIAVAYADNAHGKRRG